MKFEGYHFTEEVTKGLKELGFKKPTDIQYKSIPHILQGEDVFAIAQTGTGKTGAYAIPIINSIQLRKQTERRPDGIKCIILVPTHELALQQEKFFNQVAKYTKVKTLGLMPGDRKARMTSPFSSKRHSVLVDPLPSLSDSNPQEPDLSAMLGSRKEARN